MARALLLLTGGRGIPDMLVVKYLHPDFVYNITTKEGLPSAKNLQKVIRSEFGCEMEILETINPFNEEEIKGRCKEALQRHPDAEWIITINSAPKIVSIFACDLAREKNIPCWFLNTNDGEVISLSKDFPVDTEELFKATVDEYMKVYERDYEIPKSKDYRNLVQSEAYYNIARTLAHAPEATHFFIKALRQAQHGQARNNSISLTIGDPQVKSLVQSLAVMRALTIDDETSSGLQCTISNGDMREFLNGDWLEVYVWKEVNKADFAHDNQWGYKIRTGQAESELDVVLTSRGVLLIAECKTDEDPFTEKRKTYLDTLDSIASWLGRTYVSKFFITNHPNPDTVQSYKSFRQQATQKRIFVLNGKDLPDIGNTLKLEAKDPTFPRI